MGWAGGSEVGAVVLVAHPASRGGGVYVGGFVLTPIIAIENVNKIIITHENRQLDTIDLQMIQHQMGGLFYRSKRKGYTF